jgi:hypothetical protein
MKARLTTLAALLLPSFLHAQVTFKRTFGGAGSDQGFSVQQTVDGGYIIAGRTTSFGAGAYDVYLIKTSVAGFALWTATYGGPSDDFGFSVQQTTDSGYIIAGMTKSRGAGDFGVYLVKTNAAGDTLWTRAYGGTDSDQGWSVQQTTDGGYIIVGTTWSYGAGSADIYLIKTGANGDTLWTRTYGGADNDYAYSVQQTADDGYIIAGFTLSFGAGSEDIYLVKTNAAGDTLWTRTYGGTDPDNASSVQQTVDGGYIITGYTMSFGAGSEDVYLIRTNAAGDTVWTRTYGGTSIDAGNSVQQASDGGYVIAGHTESFGAGGQDAWLIRTDADGDTLWTRTFGDTADEDGRSVQQTADGGFLVAGWINSFGAGGYDVYLIKTDSLGNVGIEEPWASPARAPAVSLSCEPNPSSGTTRISLTPQAASSKPLTLRMYDSQGRMVLSREVSTSSFPLSTSDLPSGAYFIRCDDGSEHAIARVVLQR